MQMQLLKAVKNMSDGFSLVLAKNDLNAISNQYLSLKKEYEDNIGPADWFHCMKHFGSLMVLRWLLSM